MKQVSTFSEAVTAYLSHADYLTDDDLPMVIALRLAAAELDENGVQAALLNTFGVTYRSLQKKAGTQESVSDPALDFLNDL